MSKFDDMIYGLQQDTEIPEKVWAKYTDTLSKLPDKQKQPSYTMAKRRMWPVAVAATLAVGVVSAGAAAYIQWSSSLSKGLQATDAQMQMAEDSGLAAFPEMSVTDGGVTVTAQQSIVDNYYAYLSFKVEGYEPPQGVQPGFDVVDVSVDGAAISAGSHFYNGLIRGADGRAVRADGQPIPENEDGEWILDYTMEDGSLEYRLDVTESEGRAALIGKEISVRLEDLGLYDNRGNIETKVEGVWTFKWTLQGSEEIRTFQCHEPLGDTGAVVAEVEISPISVRVLYDFPMEEIEEPAEDGETGETFTHMTYAEPPMFSGVRLKDGTMLTRITDGPGCEGYIDGNTEQYTVWTGLDRILEVDQIESLLFIKSFPEGEGPLAEENLYFVSL